MTILKRDRDGAALAYAGGVLSSSAAVLPTGPSGDTLLHYCSSLKQCMILQMLAMNVESLSLALLLLLRRHVSPVRRHHLCHKQRLNNGHLRWPLNLLHRLVAVLS